jgi:hypothetical protein
MQRPTALLFALSCLIATPLLAQNVNIGGGTCNSSTLNGNYALSLNARQVTSAGAFTNVFQANGSASFDGQSTVKISLAADTLQASATQLSWSGTYSVQANCEGQLTINSGANVTFNMVIYSIGTAAGTSILLTGNDATYAYSGSGNAQPASCSVGMLSGVYTFNATGFSLNGMAVNGAVNGAGLLQFDGQGNLTTSITLVSSGSSVSEAGSITGKYSLSNCVGSATLSDSNHTYTMSISISGGNTTASTTAFVTFSRNGKFMVSGAAHAAYGQPTSSPASPTSAPPSTLSAITGGRP